MQIRKWISNIVFRNTVYSLIEIAVPAILMLVSTPYLLTSMGTINYGLWNLALAFLGLIGIGDVGVGAATTKYVAEFYESNDISSLSETITTSLVISMIIGIILTSILYLLSPWFASFFASQTQENEVLLIFRVCIFGLFPLMLENVGLAIPRGFQDYKATSVLQVTKNVVTVLWAIWIVSKKEPTSQIIIGTVVIIWSFAIGSWFVAYRRINKLGLSIRLSFKTFGKMIEFMLYMGLTGIGIKIFTLLDRVVVAQTLGLEVSAYYSIATGIANKFTALGSATTQALFPAFSSWNVKQDKQSIWRKLKLSTLIVGLVAIIPGIILLLFSRPIVYWWLGEINGGIILIPVQILIFIYMIKTITAPAYQAANGLGMPSITTLAVAIASLGTIGLIIVLGSMFGLVGASWANIASWSLFIIIFYLHKVLKRDEPSFSPGKLQ